MSKKTGLFPKGTLNTHIASTILESPAGSVGPISSRSSSDNLKENCSGTSVSSRFSPGLGHEGQELDQMEESEINISCSYHSVQMDNFIPNQTSNTSTLPPSDLSDGEVAPDTYDDGNTSCSDGNTVSNGGVTWFDQDSEAATA